MIFSTADINNFVLDFPREVVFAVLRMLDFLESIPDSTPTSSKASHIFARLAEMEHFAFLGQDHREELSMGDLFDVFAFVWHFDFGQFALFCSVIRAMAHVPDASIFAQEHARIVHCLDFYRCDFTELFKHAQFIFVIHCLEINSSAARKNTAEFDQILRNGEL